MNQPQDPGGSYLVYPQSLRAAAESIFRASDAVARFGQTELPGRHLADGDLGILGRISGLTDLYNGVVEAMANRRRSSANILRDFATVTDKAADYYETVDEEGYREMKKTGAGIK